jgi:hypothetical protein
MAVTLIACATFAAACGLVALITREPQRSAERGDRARWSAAEAELANLDALLPADLAWLDEHGGRVDAWRAACEVELIIVTVIR